MKQVFEQYGSTVIAVILATAIFTVVLGGRYFQEKGFHQVLGQMLEYSISETSISENETFPEYMRDVMPTIVQKEHYAVRENENVLLSDCFEARSNKGEILSVHLQKAWKLDGEETDLGLSSDGKSICVPEAGVYWLQLYATDSNQKQTSVMVKLLVNER